MGCLLLEAEAPLPAFEKMSMAMASSPRRSSRLRS